MMKHSPAPAFVSVYREHASFVLSVIRRRGIAEPAVDDVLQEVFIIVHRRLQEFRGAAALRSWLARIADNVVRNYRRASRRRAMNESLAADISDTVEPTDPNDDPLTLVCRREAYDAVNDVVASLGAAKARVFLLSEVEELTPAQIATTTSTTLHTVYTRRRAARKLFKKKIRRLALIEGWEVAQAS